MRKTRQIAAALIVPSADFAGTFGRNWCVAPEKLHVVHHGVRTGEGGEARAILERLGIGRPFMLSVTNALPHKNTAALLHAYGQVVAGRGELAPLLVLAGDITEADLDRWISEGSSRGVRVSRESILRTGFLDETKLDALYRHAQMLVLTTTIESSSLPVIEAMARACPVIASDIPVHREIGGDAALLVDLHAPGGFADAMQRLLDDDALRRRLGAAGEQRARQFTWEECARKTAAVYAHAANA